MQSGGFGSRSALAISGLAFLLICALVSSRIYTNLIADRQVADREQALVANGMKGWVSEVEGKVIGQTTWSDAVQHLGVRYDATWARDNIGKFLHDSAHFERAFVLDRADRPVFAMSQGREVSGATFQDVQAIALPLVLKVRQMEVVAGRSIANPGASPTVPGPLQASAFGLVRDLPCIVTATLVQPDFDQERRLKRAPVVVTVDTMDAEFQRAFSQRFLIEDLHIHTGSGTASEPLEASSELRDAHGGLVARMDWTPQRPARTLFRKTWPILILAMLLFCAAVAVMFLRGRRATQALVASETRAKHMAYHDHLTGLPNRAMFAERMAQALADMRRTGRAIGVLALDLDRFKLVNDTYGHAAGDELITDIAARLKSLVRDSDIVARLGGDEFAILHADADPRGLWALAGRIVTELSRPIDLPFGRVFPGASVGVTITTDANSDGVEVLRQADLAMYRAKDGGRSRFEFYEPEMDLALKSRHALEGDLREALRSDLLTMVYQPQVDGERKVVGLEALVRWTHPQRGPVSPAFFVAIAEECGLIGELGEFTLRRAFTDSRRWPRLTVAVNVSAIQLRGGDFHRLAARLLRETGADPRRIELEITEGALLEDDQATHHTLSRLRTMGFSLALDDFGTGYSSLAYLRRYPIDKIKIDRSFITNLGAEQEAEAVVGAIVRLARALNLKVIAEGVETSAQRSSLGRAGCHHIQGFLYSPPIPAEAVAEFVAERNADAGRPPRAKVAAEG